MNDTELLVKCLEDYKNQIEICGTNNDRYIINKNLVIKMDEMSLSFLAEDNKCSVIAKGLSKLDMHCIISVILKNNKNNLKIK